MSDDKLETCEVHLMDANKDDMLSAVFSIPTHKFVAKAAGPEGPFIAGESKIITGEPNSNSPEHLSILDTLNTELKKDGWEYIEQGENWWSYKYHRTARS